MKNELNDKEIVSLYKESANETPSPELDKKILAYAKSASGRRKNWWPYLGLAASLGFVVILAPWRWVDQTMPVVTEPELPAAIEPQVTEEQADQRIEAKRAKMPVRESMMSAPLKMQAAPEADMAAGARSAGARSKEEKEIQTGFMDAEVNISSFEEVEALLASGEKEKAKALLERILKQSPELARELPQHLRQLVDKTKTE
ncbi:hypothetical protein L3Q72_17720 [Vibrio sp. JC009]|uniref:hypothetical protein n=1 Tax=Vibrio sp. JC009 TaxID=2912314 RepID=UPI0023B09BDB|nr:hypothetical protein [Vibrio sp. JC009]WED24715.1 hypothetical protein L3Q72_17720 [Vibrio sp. JC009]